MTLGVVCSTNKIPNFGIPSSASLISSWIRVVYRGLELYMRHPHRGTMFGKCEVFLHKHQDCEGLSFPSELLVKVYARRRNVLKPQCMSVSDDKFQRILSYKYAWPTAKSAARTAAIASHNWIVIATTGHVSKALITQKRNASHHSQTFCATVASILNDIDRVWS